MHHIIVIYGTVVCALHISGIMHHIIVIYGTVVWNDDISSHFFHFFKILVFWVVRGEKAKNGPKLKKFCLSHSTPQEPYIIRLLFMEQLCKMIMSTGIFFVFWKFWFSWLLGGKRAKKSPKWQKILFVVPYISGPIHHMVIICGGMQV